MEVVYDYFQPLEKEEDLAVDSASQMEQEGDTFNTCYAMFYINLNN